MTSINLASIAAFVNSECLHKQFYEYAWSNGYYRDAIGRLFEKADIEAHSDYERICKMVLGYSPKKQQLSLENIHDILKDAGAVNYFYRNLSDIDIISLFSRVFLFEATKEGREFWISKKTKLESEYSNHNL